jgi:hypothetical protein
MTDRTEDDRITEIPHNRALYEQAACALTAPDTLPPEAVQASDPYENEDNDNA